jgi:protein associated with RNAse G/E
MEESSKYIDYNAYVKFLRQVAEELVDKDAIREKIKSLKEYSGSVL